MVHFHLHKNILLYFMTVFEVTQPGGSLSLLPPNGIASTIHHAPDSSSTVLYIFQRVCFPISPVVGSNFTTLLLLFLVPASHSMIPPILRIIPVILFEKLEMIQCVFYVGHLTFLSLDFFTFIVA